jgi:hypothetical protein
VTEPQAYSDNVTFRKARAFSAELAENKGLRQGGGGSMGQTKEKQNLGGGVPKSPDEKCGVSEVV